MVGRVQLEEVVNAECFIRSLIHAKGKHGFFFSLKRVAEKARKQK